jgi:hypothetical protein
MPKIVKAKVIRTVKEIALIELENDGSIRNYIEQIDELDSDIDNVIDVIEVVNEC